MDRIEVIMELERETKNKVRYKEKDGTAGLDQLYISKVALKAPFPGKVKVIVEEG